MIGNRGAAIKEFVARWVAPTARRAINSMAAEIRGEIKSSSTPWPLGS